MYILCPPGTGSFGSFGGVLRGTAASAFTSPLLMACRGGHTATAEMLLDRGADLTAKDEVSVMIMLA